MQRYLLNVSYIGTQFRGVQKIICGKESNKPDWTTIQGVLELGLARLNPVNYPTVTISSRTDKGVHALSSAFHVDLKRPARTVYDPTAITIVLNKFFMKHNLQLRVLGTQSVPNTFHCRFHAISRTYLYRFAILKSKLNTQQIPIEELYRCYFISNTNFDFVQMQKSMSLFEGKHDFRTFMGRGGREMGKMTRRCLDKIELVRGCTSVFQHDISANYDYWTILVKSEGFLYNQVRRIVGTLVAVGEGKLTNRDIRFMLEVPSHLSWNPRILIAPSYALYLSQVDYENININ